MNFLNFLMSVLGMISMSQALPMPVSQIKDGLDKPSLSQMNLKKLWNWNWDWLKPNVEPNRKYLNATGGYVAKTIEGNIIFHAFKGINDSITVNIVEFPTQLLIIDFGFELPFALNAAKYVKNLYKTSITCFLTHSHSDHFSGYEAFKDLCKTTYALSDTIDRVRQYNIPEVTIDQIRTGSAIFTSKATPIGPTTLQFDNIHVVFESWSNIESADFLFIRIPCASAMFVGDTVHKDGHAFLENNHDLSIWFKALLKYKWYGYRNVFLGHGLPIDFSNDKVFNQFTEYLTFVGNVANTYKKQDEYEKLIYSRYPTFEDRVIVPCPFSICAPFSNGD